MQGRQMLSVDRKAMQEILNELESRAQSQPRGQSKRYMIS